MGWLYLLAATAAVVANPVWRVLGYWVTYLHEIGHGTAALVVGGRVRAVRVHQDASGVTEWSGEVQLGLLGAVRWRAMAVFVLLAGYTAPGAAAVVWAMAWSSGGTAGRAGLWVTAGVGALSLAGARGWRTVTVAAATAAAAMAGLRWEEIGAGVLAAASAVAAAGGVRSSFSLWRTPVRRGDGSDPGQLAQVTGIPARVWSGLFLAVSLGCAGACTAAAAGWLTAP